MKFELSLDGGKYTYRFDNGKQDALRYGEPWRDLCGDKFIYCLAAEVRDLREAAGAKESLVTHVQELLDDDYLPGGAMVPWANKARSILAVIQGNAEPVSSSIVLTEDERRHLTALMETAVEPQEDRPSGFVGSVWQGQQDAWASILSKLQS